MSELDQLKAELERAKAQQKEDLDLMLRVTSELERVQKKAAAMREALTIAKRAIGWESLDSEKVMGPIRAALQPDAGSDYIRREDVMPLVDALRHISTDDRYPHPVVLKAIDHAKSLGLL